MIYVQITFFHCIHLFSFGIKPFWVTMWFVIWFEPQSVMKHIVHLVLRCQELGSYIFTIKCFLSLLGALLKLDYLVAQQLLTKYTYVHVILIIKKFLFLQKLFYKFSTNSQILDPRKKTLYSILCCVEETLVAAMVTWEIADLCFLQGSQRASSHKVKQDKLYITARLVYCLYYTTI